MEKLQRQRALLHEHLRWLDSEIAAEASTITPAKSATDAADTAPTSAPPTAPIPLSDSIAPVADVPEADVRGIHSEVRSGCLLYFAVAFVLLGLVVAFVYWRY